MSLASIKQKELKGKKNVLPKLRTILANPYKQHCPVLPDIEVMEFRNLLKKTISCSRYSSQTFATQTHIHLGLESSLRAINGRRFSCVFVSLSIRPSHLLRLIATSAAVKIPTAPIYAQPKLEELTHELFGVRALTLVLPLELDYISAELAKWVNARRKPLVQLQKAPPRAVEKLKTKKPAQDIIQNNLVEQQVAAPKEQKEWSGDYISCLDGDELKLDQVDVQVEKQLLGKALSNMAMKAQAKTAINENTIKTKTIETTPTVERMQIDTDEDEFLPASELSDYQPVTVHQICPNPDKKPKKKRNKNKQKKTQLPLNKTNA